MGTGEPQIPEDLATGLAHVLRNRLNSLEIDLGILERELQPQQGHGDSVAVARVSRLRRSLTEIGDLLTDFLRYARPEPPVLADVSLRALLADLVAFLTPECASRGVALVTSCDEVRLRADATQLKRALLDILLNALDAACAGGSIVLAGGARGGGAQVEVRDGGSGIPAHLRDQVFAPFVSGRPGGTGLGLAIARRTVEAHGGTIAIASGAQGGTTVTLTLPLGAEAAP